MRYVRLDPGGTVYRLALDPAGGRLLALVDRGFEHDRLTQLHEWDLASGRQTRVSFVRWDGAFAPDGRWVASVGHQDTAGVSYLVIHDLSVPPAREPPVDRELHRQVVGTPPDPVFDRLWRYPVVEFEALDRFCYFGGVPPPAVSPDGRLVAAGGVTEDYGADDYAEVRLIDVETGDTRAARTPATTDALAFAPDGRTLVGVRSGALDVWDVATLGRRTWGRRRTRVGPLAVGPDGRAVALAGKRRLAVLDLGTDPPAVRAVHPGRAEAVLFHPDGRLFAAGPDGLVRVWDAAGRPTGVFDWRIGPLHSLAFAPDGLTAAAGGRRGRVVLWDLG
jgi:WD40 repeat protein